MGNHGAAGLFSDHRRPNVSSSSLILAQFSVRSVLK